MQAKADPPRGGGAAGPVELRRLLPPASEATAVEIVDSLKLRERTATAPGRPYVALNMVSSTDGRASVEGRSGALGNRADHEFFHALRGAVDAVMVGAGTVRAERYGRIVRDESAQRRRVEAGLSAEPLACIVSGRLDLTPEIPLLAAAEARVVIVTSSEATVPAGAARLDYVRARRDGKVDLAAALGELHERFAVRTVLCEGGPHLNMSLLREGLVDELFLSLAPKLVGGESAGGGIIRIVEGPTLPAPCELELAAVLEYESQLLLRYGVRASAAERVSRATMPSSSLAS